MRHKPGFWFGLLSVAAFTTRDVLAEGWLSAVVAAAIGCAIGVALFPWWRRQASRDPIVYTYGQPELLADAGDILVVHPSEPLSNVHVE
ncbi:MAG: hypothetical protein JWP14_2073 [Frankiales bacterium]|nr:hypothetical protein [Frankiales bacterium]